MPDLKTYDLFISHAWRYGDDYDRMVKLLNSAPNFSWRNYSCPEHDPAIDPDTPAGKRELEEALKRQISPVNCVIILSGMYVSYSEWIQKEIDISVSYNKPIIGIKPWGQEKVPQAVREVAREIVGWNTDSIVSAIRKHSI